MIHYLFFILENLSNFLWGYVCLTMILAAGIFLSFYGNWVQVLKFPKICVYFFRTMAQKSTEQESAERGTSPARAFFASIAGCIGIGNLVTVSIAVQIGGPGALLWMWVVALLGMVIKYSEVYLGMKFRIPNAHHGYDGGPMYFLPKAFPKLTWLPFIMAGLLCVYGIEIFMFSVIKESISINWGFNPVLVTLVLLGLVLFGISGGVNRVGAISRIAIPGFVLVFLGMTIWVLMHHVAEIPEMLSNIFFSAFSGHAAAGGFLGSSIVLAIAKGFSAASYSGDVGIGYASIITSESRAKEPSKQASLAIFGIFLDTFVVCTCSVLLIIATGTWMSSTDGSMMVQDALSQYFPYMNIFMPVFLFVLGYTTILPYMVAGMKCARFISPKNGARFYTAYGICAFILFSFVDATYALTIMNLAGGLLMLVNLPAIIKLRHEIKFDLKYLK